MLQIAICDDETAQCSLLESYVREWERLRRQEADIALVGNGEQLLFHWEERLSPRRSAPRCHGHRSPDSRYP